MAILLSLVALCLAWLAGLGTVTLLGLTGSRSDPGIHGAALVCGSGFVTVTTVVLGFIVHGILLHSVIVIMCLWLGWCWWKGMDPAVPAQPGPGPLSRFLLVVMLSASVGVTWLSLYRESLDWDGLFNWEAKAHIAFINQGTIPLTFYTNGYDFFHKSYPPMLPLLETWIYTFVGHADQSMAKLVGPYFYLAAALLVLSVGLRQTTTQWAAASVVAPFLLIPAFFIGEGSAASGYADFPLAVVYLCCIVNVCEYWNTSALYAARVAGISGALLPLTKAEGIILVLAVMIAAAPVSMRRRDWRAAIWIVLPGVTAWAAWRAMLGVLRVPRESDFVPVSMDYLSSHLDRARSLVSWMAQELTNWQAWSYLWIFLLIAVALALRNAQRWRWYPGSVAVLVPLVIYPCVYLFTAWNSVEAHVKSSLPRLLIHIAPTAAVVAGVAFAEVLGAARAKRQTDMKLETVMISRSWRAAILAIVMFGVGFGSGYLARSVQLLRPALPQTSSRLTIPAGQVVVGYLDQVDGKPIISAPQNADVHVSGWAGCSDRTHPISKIEVMVDDQIVALATLSLARSDVAAAFGREDFRNSGWTASFHPQGIQEGTHTIAAQATCSDGRSGALPPFQLIVTKP